MPDQSRWMPVGEAKYALRRTRLYIAFLGGQGWTVWEVTAVGWGSDTHRIEGHEAKRISGPHTHFLDAMDAAEAYDRDGSA